MIVQCPKCEKKYKIDSSKVTEAGAKITCSNCGHVFIVRQKAKEEKEDFLPYRNSGKPATPKETAPPEQFAPEPKTEQSLTEDEKPPETNTVPLMAAAETRKPKMRRHSLLAIANRADDGFLSIVRSAGKAVHFIQSSTMGGLSKIEHTLSRKKKEKKFRQPGRTREIKERAPTDETREESVSFPPEVTAKSDVD